MRRWISIIDLSVGLDLEFIAVVSLDKANVKGVNVPKDQEVFRIDC